MFAADHRDKEKKPSGEIFYGQLRQRFSCFVPMTRGREEHCTSCVTQSRRRRPTSEAFSITEDSIYCMAEIQLGDTIPAEKIHTELHAS